MIGKATIKRKAFQFLCRLGLDAISRRRHARQLLVVMYHGVVSDDSKLPPSWLLLPESAFAAQIAFLACHYDVIPVSQAVAHLANADPFKRPTACITFDDGFRNNLTLALPILQKHNVPATVYLATGFIDTDRIHWTVLLERAINTAEQSSLDLTAAGLGVFPLGKRRRQTFVTLKTTLYRQSESERQRRLVIIFTELAFNPRGGFSGHLSMTWDEAEAMQDTGLIEFGGHTVNHQITSALTDAGLRDEVCGSMREIGERLGKPATTFAYPNGTLEDFTEDAKRAVREAGGIAALTTIEGLNPISSDLLALRRIAVGNDTGIHEFRLLASGLLTQLRGRRPR